MVAGHLRVQNGYWQMILSYKDLDGGRKTKSISTHLKEKGNKKRAEQMLLVARSQFSFDEIGTIGQNDILFSEFMVDWLHQIKPSVAPTTFMAYSSVIYSSICPYFIKRYILLKELRPKHITEYYDHLMARGLSPTTVLRHHANIRKALQKAVTLDLILVNPAKRVTLPQKDKFMASYYSTQEAAELLKAVAGSVLELPVALALICGLRRSEVLGLHWEAIDFQRKIIHITNSVNQVKIDNRISLVERDILKRRSSYRTLPIPDNIFQLLVAKRKASGYICLDEHGEILHPDRLSRRFITLLERNGLRKIRFHDLRHTCASLLIAEQVPLIEVQQWLGHSTLFTTADLYCHLEFSTQQKSAAVLNNLFKST
jgi:integrase